MSSYFMPIPASKVRGKQLELETQWTRDQAIVPEGDLLFLAARMLDDRHRLANHRLALRHHYPVEPILRQHRRVGLDSDQREIESRVRTEETIRVELKHSRLQRASIGAVLEPKLDRASPSHLHRRQHMMVRSGIKAPDAQLAAVNLSRDDFHGEWNYLIKPNT